MVQIVITENQLSLIKQTIISEKGLNDKQSINESLFGVENMLMLAGFVPVIGEIADIALICYYLYKGEKLYAALMLIALIPTVGDFIAKPIIKLFKGSREGAAAMKAGGDKLAEYLAKNPKIASKYSSLGKYVNTPAVEKTIEGIAKVNTGWASSLKNGLKEISGGSTLSGLKAGTKEVMAGGKFGSGLKGYYQNERLTKYFNKKNILPETGIKRWWLKVGARKDRRDSFRKFIMANNLLAYFGVPSLSTFERKMSEDAEFREKIADDPKTSNYIAKNYNSEDGSDTATNNSNTTSTQGTSSSTSNSVSSDPLGKLINSLLTGGSNTSSSFA
jgi:hypothetical protein